MKSQLFKTFSILILSAAVGTVAHAQHRGNGYPPGTKGNPGGAGGRNNPPPPQQRNNPPPRNNGYPSGTKGNPGGYGNHPGNNGGYRPAPPPVYRPNNNGGRYNPYPAGTKGNPRPIVIRRYDNHVGYAGNRVVYRDRFDNRGYRVRTVYGYNNRQRECFYRPVNLFGINFYIYNSRYDVHYYSRFPRAFPSVYANSWFHTYDPWYGRYSGFYAYRTYYNSPSQWLLDYYYSNLLRSYQEELAQEQAYSTYQNQYIQSQIDENTRYQLESQIQQSMYSGQVASVTDTALRDPNHLYVVSEEVNALNQYGQSCSVTRGDVIQLNGAYYGTSTASMIVVSSKDESCDAGSILTLSIDQIQEFENDMAADIDDGLDLMANDTQLRNTLGQ
jgi:hypothetical protein